jgi:hypothetical protein
MLYSAFYFYTKLDMSKGVPTAMYFGYMFMVSYSFFVLTGTIGFVSCLLFVRTQPAHTSSGRAQGGPGHVGAAICQRSAEEGGEDGLRG